jgi:broad specificity phosphatase PhoE
MVRGNVLIKIYLVRHAKSKKNVMQLPGTPEKQLDTLTTKGREQAVAIGHFLKDKDIVAIQSSPTGRTRETAQAMSEVIGLPGGFEVEEAFSSLRGGKGPDGNPVSWPWREQQWALGNDPRPEEGESMSDGEIRARSALEKLAERFAGKSHRDRFPWRYMRCIAWVCSEYPDTPSVCHSPGSHSLSQRIHHNRYLVAYCRSRKTTL